MEGIAEVWYDTGVKESEGLMKHGEKHGKWTFYNSDGSSSYIATFNNGLEHGNAIEFDTNGTKVGYFKFVHGELDSVGTVYFPGGQVLSRTKYVNGVPDGFVHTYFENSNIKDSFFFKQGLKQGEIKSHYESGQIYIVGNYEDDKIHGKMIVYHLNGNIMSEHYHSNGIPEGIWRYCSERGVGISSGIGLGAEVSMYETETLESISFTWDQSDNVNSQATSGNTSWSVGNKRPLDDGT